MVLDKQRCAVGVLSSNQDAESALKKLIDSGFSVEKIGVIAKDSGRPSHRGNAKLTDTIAERGQAGATMGVATGTAQGGIGGLLVGFGTLAIPGGGTLIAADSIGTELANIVGGDGIGAFPDSWVRVLAGRGIPEKRASVYSDLVERGNCLLMLEGIDQQLTQAESILRDLVLQEWEIYDFQKNDNALSDNSTIQANERKVSNLGSQPNSPTNV